jgi:hypothetical protein
LHKRLLLQIRSPQSRACLFRVVLIVESAPIDVYIVIILLVIRIAGNDRLNTNIDINCFSLLLLRTPKIAGS